MSKKRSRKTLRTTAVIKPEYDRLDYLAAVPGSLMIFMAVMMLLLDISMPGMQEDQYTEFPGMFRVLNGASIFAGCVFIALGIAAKRFSRISRIRLTSWIGFGGFLLCIAVSTAVNGLTTEVIHGVSYRNIGIFHMLAFLVVYMAVTSCIRRESLRSKLLQMYLLAADAVAIAALADVRMGAIAVFHEKTDLSAIFFNGNNYGYYLVMAVLIAAGYCVYGEKKNMYLGAASLLINGIALAINHSMGCMLAVFTAVTIFAIIEIAGKTKCAVKALILLCVMLASSVFFALVSEDIRGELIEFITDIAAIMNGDISSSAGHNRWLLWTQTAEYIYERPITGYGCEGIHEMLFVATGRGDPHSEILTYAAYYGIPAALLYTASVLYTLISCLRRTSAEHGQISAKIAGMAAAGYFISALFGVAMFYTAPFFYIFMGIASAEDDP